MQLLAIGDVEPEHLRLPAEVVAHCAELPDPWNRLPGEGALAHAIFLTRYSRRLPDGTKERWVDVCRRVTEGTFSVLKSHCRHTGRAWDESLQQRTACEFFTRMFSLRFTPAGRGLWAMGTSLVEHGEAAALNNCGFISTGRIRTSARHLMDAAILGVGVGFDVEGAGAPIMGPRGSTREPWRVIDDRAGWTASLDRLLATYLDGAADVDFNYADMQPAGNEPLTFGGVAGGPEALGTLHARVRRQFAGRAGGMVTISDVVDLMNTIGACVSASNVRRGAELALGPRCAEFLDLKNPRVASNRNDPVSGWGWISNNTVAIDKPGQDYGDLVERMALNGEPGLFWRYVAQAYGRLADGRTDTDWRVSGLNPCGEQPLEHGELCALVETFPTRHEDAAEFNATLRLALLYSKAITLLATGWDASDAVIERNRRVGCSITGVAQFADRRGWDTVERWLDAGYAAIREEDDHVSTWLGISRSIKTTTVKPSGTVSILAGVTPGVHWPVAQHVIRRVSLAPGPVSDALADAGYPVMPMTREGAEPMSTTEFVVRYADCRPDTSVSLAEKLGSARLCQRVWADNAVSVTITFDPRTQTEELEDAITRSEGQLKSMSALPYAPADYGPMPYEPIGPEAYRERLRRQHNIDWGTLYRNAEDGAGDHGCSNAVCSDRL